MMHAGPIKIFYHSFAPYEACFEGHRHGVENLGGAAKKILKNIQFYNISKDIRPKDQC